MTTLPQPEISVEATPEGTASSSRDVAITASRDGKSRIWSGTGGTIPEAVKGAVEKMLSDPHTAEYVKRA
jgi:hypothetical protein